MPLLALGEFCRDELCRRALHHFPVKPRHQLVVEGPVAGEKSRLQDRGTDGHVATRLADRFIDRTRGVADLQAHVP
jgi:hypothetical protein